MKTEKLKDISALKMEQKMIFDEYAKKRCG